MRKKMLVLCFAAMGLAVSLFAANVQLPARAIFYYAWFPQTWSVDGDHVFYNPTLGYYDSGKTNIVDAHIQALTYAKINVGIVSWWGPKRSNEETRIPLILNRTVAKGSNIKWAFYYEQAGFPESYDLSVSGIRSNLNYLSRYTNHAACAKIDGKPVIFVYNINADSSKVASNWKTASNGKWYVVLKVFKDWAKVTDQPDAWHQYGPSTAVNNVGDAYTISPGFWRADMATANLSRDLNRWAGNVRDMVASGKKWQLITTFNEWGEGTAVESAKEWSSSSGYGKYLDLLHTDGVAETVQTKTFTSISAQDGYVNESSETSSVGGSLNATNSAGAGLRVGDMSDKKQVKTFLTFDTSSIPDGAVVKSATLKLMRGAISGKPTTLGSIKVDIKGGSGFSGSATLQNSDFEAAADAANVATMSYPSANGKLSTGNLSSTGLSKINKTGKTQLRVYFATDDDNDATSDYLGFYPAENATVANRPVLVITYQ